MQMLHGWCRLDFYFAKELVKSLKTCKTILPIPLPSEKGKNLERIFIWRVLETNPLKSIHCFSDYKFLLNLFGTVCSCFKDTEQHKKPTVIKITPSCYS